MKLRLMLLSAAAIALATPALAEPFAGGYLGAEVGADNYNIKTTDALGFGETFDGLSADGAVYGVFAGWDFALGDKVFAGLEVSANNSGAKVSLDVPTGPDQFGYGLSIEAQESYGIAARLGVMVNDNTAIYGKLGRVKTKFKASVKEEVDYNPITNTATYETATDSDSETATQYGVGLESKLGKNWSLRAEYTVLDYGDGGLGDGVDVKNSQTRVGAAFRF